MSEDSELNDDGTALGVNAPGSVPIHKPVAQPQTDVAKVTGPSQLPSHMYRYAVWHDLRENAIRGTQLQNPRVRRGPERKEQDFYKEEDEHGRKLYHGMKGLACKNYQKKTEDWENAVYVNLSYQELGHPYQLENFSRIMKRILRAEKITLIDNSLEDMHSINLPICRILNLSQNYFKKFSKLPKCRNVTTLLLADNSIETLDGIGSIGGKELQVLNLRRNPCTFIDNYRKRVFRSLPHLAELDGIPKLDSDLEEFEDLDMPTRGCILS
ncbi:uncharacterized protein LOC117123577 isoform X2 [Anneissia japonica]|uniref:uncharacterized protein LOC117123577 isoform X2 n=1 Tax=Anneissia japonica TaxID=1529436 RepID=UPI001425AB27|nr:uncharacterized protein LOC117123577 isoform X2 [Anneissia japonica]